MRVHIEVFLDTQQTHKSADVQHQEQQQQHQQHQQHQSQHESHPQQQQQQQQQNTNSNANGSSVGVVGSEHHASIYPRQDENHGNPRHGSQNIHHNEMDINDNHLKTTALNVLDNQTTDPSSNVENNNIHDAINNGIMPDTPQLGYFGEV